MSRWALSEWRGVCGRQRLLRRLSRRESEVLALIQEGRTNQEIAQELALSLGTVKNHVHGVLTKLEVTTRTQAAKFGGA